MRLTIAITATRREKSKVRSPIVRRGCRSGGSTKLILPILGDNADKRIGNRVRAKEC
ncbi:hypothetical protein GCM10009655_14210 [Rhodoglobus aureus]|uniref:Uncharacterized protein n=1 Tax=Rhodoglobus aureus TaxID=191497 RepID=A0ABP4G7Q3_9MICO